jgi:hypothetical protein
MMRKGAVLWIVAAFIAIAGTGCRCYDQKCDGDYLAIKLSGFATEDLRAVVVSYYDTGGSFATVVRTDTLSGMPLNATSDTVVRLESSVYYRHDYIITFPRISRDVRLSNIRFSESSPRICPGIFSQKISECYNQPILYTVEGKTLPVSDAFLGYINIER